MKQLVIWIKGSSNDDTARPIVKVGSHWRGHTKQAKLAAYLPAAPRVSRLLTLHRLLEKIENQKFCVSRSGNIFELTDRPAIQPLLLLVEGFLTTKGYRRIS